MTSTGQSRDPSKFAGTATATNACLTGDTWPRPAISRSSRGNSTLNSLELPALRPGAASAVEATNDESNATRTRNSPRDAMSIGTTMPIEPALRGASPRLEHHPINVHERRDGCHDAEDHPHPAESPILLRDWTVPQIGSQSRRPVGPGDGSRFVAPLRSVIMAILPSALTRTANVSPKISRLRRALGATRRLVEKTSGPRPRDLDRQECRRPGHPASRHRQKPG